MYPLKNLFGFFQNYNHPIYLIPFELRMVKNEYYKKYFYGKDAAVDAKLSIVFEDLKLLVPSITCNPKLEQNVMERMNPSTPISINYLKRITASIDIPIGSIYSWRPTTLNSRPRYILIGFKDATPEFKEINSTFIQSKNDKDKVSQLKSIRIQLNTSFYPMNPLKFSYKDNYQALPYFNYIEMCNIFGVDPQLNIRDFKNHYSLFCFNVSEQGEKLAMNGVNVTIEIEKDTEFKAKYYCVILTENQVNIELKTGKMSTLS